MADGTAYEGALAPAVDVHAHYFPPSYLASARACLSDPGVPADATGFLTSYEPLENDPAFTGAVDERLKLMDAASIGVQVLSFSAGNVWHPDANRRQGLVEQFNDGCAEVVQRHPDRFRLFANMPLPFVDLAIAETERARQLPGFAGVSICTHSAGIPIDDRQWDPLYDLWNELKLPVLVHPDGFCAPGVLDGHFLGWALGAPFDDTIAAVRLMVSGTLQRFPRIKWIVPHCGGVLPFLMDRVDGIWESYRHLLPDVDRPRESVRSLILDMASGSASSVAITSDVLSSDQLLFGTDFPFANRNDLAAPRTVLEASGLSGSHLTAVLQGRAVPSISLT